MPARAHASTSRTILALVAISTFTQLVRSEEISCPKDGLYADYDSDCREYVKCVGGVVKGRYKCGDGRMFSEVAGACVLERHQLCVRRLCGPGDTLAYATPDSACRNYYRCENGTAIDHSCPAGTWFDIDRQACTRGAGICFEPLCVGLINGNYSDPSHECRRQLECIGAKIHSVASCNRDICAETCPPARSSSIPIPAGDADFCSDEACSSLCHQANDGSYADRSTGCREYFVCESKRVIRRGVCETGLLFSNGSCEPASRTNCPSPAHSPCFNHPDGTYRDWKDCRSWFECRREKVVSRGSCDPELVFNGAECVPPETFTCDGPKPSKECEGLPSGTYPDLESKCTRYFRCEGSLRTSLSCPTDTVFDGTRCSPSKSYLCPSLERDSCYGRPDGHYKASDAGCRGYFACIKGAKAVYACPAGQIFNGKTCVSSRRKICLSEDYSCSGLSDAYHPELNSNCQRYYYCEGGDRLATLSCSGGKIFDGHTCVDPSKYECGGPPLKSPENGGVRCKSDGFFVHRGTQCRKYYFCIGGVRTDQQCPDGHIFNGDICGLGERYRCQG